MAEAASSPILQQIRRVVEDPRLRGLPDRDLLRRFASRQDEAAFRTLLRRHGPMVLDVCRGVLDNDADVEDAVQATFLVLARQAASVRKHTSLASWLYGVARRTALKARARSATRHRHEARAPQRQPESPDDLSWREVRQVLHEELGGVPERYRSALVLCYLEGATQDAAAAQLGLAKSTLRERLERGRTMLRARLVRRGLGPASVLLAAAWPAATAKALPPSLVTSTTSAAIAAAEGATLLTSAEVARLTDGVMRAMSMSRLRIVTAALVVALAGLGLAARTVAVNADDPPARPTPGRESVGGGGRRPADATWKTGPTLRGHGGQVSRVAFSHDGKQLASGSRDKTVIVWDVARREQQWKLRCDGVVLDLGFIGDKTLATASGMDNDECLIKLWDLATGKEQAALPAQPHPVHRLSVSRDGKTLVSGGSPIDLRTAGADQGEVCLWDLGTRTKRATLPVALVHSALLSRDGKKLAISGSVRGGTVKLLDVDDTFAATGETVLEQDVVCGLGVSPDEKAFVVAPVSEKPTVTLREFETGGVLKSFEHTKGSVRAVAFSPDGKTLATGCWVITKDGDGGEVCGEVTFWDVDTGKERYSLKEKLPPVTSLAFSPDGKTLAVGLLHKEVVKLRKEGGSDPPSDQQTGVVTLYELR
jgi:RNA polymerase sigma factor (sigma-70 family)